MAPEVQSNASKHKAMSHERMLRAEKELEKESNALMRRAEILDAQEDKRCGMGKLGSDLPDELRCRQDRRYVNELGRRPDAALSEAVHQATHQRGRHRPQRRGDRVDHQESVFAELRIQRSGCIG
jgi:hypothetical protein